MTASTQAFDELADFFASNLSSQLANFRPSLSTSERIEWLVFKEKTEGLTQEEKDELDKFMVLEHLMRIAKAKAKAKIHLS